MDLETRRGTGRCYVQIIQNRSRAVLEQCIRAKVETGFLIWTDSFSSYQWMGKAASPFKWDCVNHSAGEFAKGFWPNRVSSNSIESLFSRMRGFFRDTKAQNTSANLSEYLGEFMWRERTFSRNTLNSEKWRIFAFWKSVEEIKGVGWEQFRNFYKLMRRQQKDRSDPRRAANQNDRPEV